MSVDCCTSTDAPTSSRAPGSKKPSPARRSDGRVGRSGAGGTGRGSRTARPGLHQVRTAPVDAGRPAASAVPRSSQPSAGQRRAVFVRRGGARPSGRLRLQAVERLRLVRGGADRRRLARAGAPRHAARRARGRRQGAAAEHPRGAGPGYRGDGGHRRLSRPAHERRPAVRFHGDGRGVPPHAGGGARLPARGAEPRQARRQPLELHAHRHPAARGRLLRRARPHDELHQRDGRSPRSRR